VSDNNELVRFERLLVTDDVVLKNAHAVQPGTHRAQPTSRDRTFQRCDNPADQRAKDYDGTDIRNRIEARAKQQARQSAVKIAELTPHLQAIAGIAVADHTLLRVIVLAHDGKSVLVEPRLEISDDRFGSSARTVYMHHDIVLSHGLPPSALDGTYTDSVALLSNIGQL